MPASVLLPIAAAAVFGALQLTASAESGEALGAPSKTVLAAAEQIPVEEAQRQRVQRPRGPRPHRLAVLDGGVGLAERPGGPKAIQIGRRTEFGSRRVLAVAAQRGDWLGVVTPERPNNRLAWVNRRHRSLRIRRTRLSLHADLSARTLTLRRAGRRVHRLRVAIGRPGSPTPTGRFAVTDKLGGARFGSYYGCCILALNGHQPNLPPGWTGGNRLAIHGTNAPGTVGAAASAGCLRAGDADLRVLMARVPLGTPVFIHG